jgi:hypothetical protein
MVSDVFNGIRDKFENSDSKFDQRQKRNAVYWASWIMRNWLEASLFEDSAG